jgi:thioredoxin 1
MALVHITKENYEQEVLQSKQTVLLDFYADWCGPCKMIAPILEEIAKEREDIKIGKINVDNDMQLAMDFKVTSIPLLVVMKDGQAVAQSLGAVPKQKILDLLG